MFVASSSRTSDEVCVSFPAEKSLSSVELQPNFPILLLKLVENPSTDQTVRFAGVIYFKNFVKRHWEQVCSIILQDMLCRVT